VPDTRGELEDADGLGDEADAVGVVVDEDEDDGELLQAAAASPRHAMPNAAANRLLDDRNLSIPRR
jgi:hypothetical protein